MIHSYKGISLVNKGPSTNTCNNVEEPPKPLCQVKKIRDRRYFQYDSTYKTFWKRHNSRDKIRSVAAQLGGGISYKGVHTGDFWGDGNILYLDYLMVAYCIRL